MDTKAKKEVTVKKETAAKTVSAVKTAPAKAAPAKTAADKVTPKEKPAAKKTAVRKTPAKKTTAKKEMKVKTVVEYYGRQVEEKDMIASVKKAWTKSGKRVGDIETIELYIKPEDGAVYYVINGESAGAVSF